MKKPAGVGRRRARILPDLSGRLVQAMAVRRHGVSMMMVMPVMAAALHLPFKLKAMPWHCQIEIFLWR
jgi:hypothetical protein